MKIKLLVFVLFAYVQIIEAQTSLDSLKLIIPKGHSNSINDFAISHDKTKAATVGIDNLLVLWDLKTRRELFECSGHNNWVVSVDFSPNDLWLVTTSWDKTVIVWNVQTGEKVNVYSDISEYAESADFFNDSQRVLLYGGARGNDEVTIFDGFSGRTLKKYEGHIAIRARCDSFLIVGNDYEGAIYSINIYTDEIKYLFFLPRSNEDSTIGFGHDITSLSLSEDNSYLLVTGGFDPVLFDIRNNGIFCTLKGHRKRQLSCGFFSDDKRIITLDEELAIIWDTNSGSKIADFQVSNTGQFAISLDGSYFVLQGLDGFHIYETTNFTQISFVQSVVSFNLSDSKYNASYGLITAINGNSLNYIKSESSKEYASLSGKTKSNTLMPSKSSLNNNILGGLGRERFFINLRNPSIINFTSDNIIEIVENETKAIAISEDSILTEIDLETSARSPLFIFDNKKELPAFDYLKVLKKKIIYSKQDSIFIFDKRSRKISKFKGSEFAISADEKLIAYTINENIIDEVFVASNSISVSDIESCELLYSNRCPNCEYSQLKFNLNSRFLITTSYIGAWASSSFVHDILQNKIIDTIGIEVYNINFANNDSVLYYNEEPHFESIEKENTNFRNFLIRSDIAEVRGKNPNFDFNGKKMTTNLNDTIFFYSMPDFKLIKTLSTNNLAVQQVVYNSSSEKLVSVVSDNSILVWDVNLNKLIYSFFNLEASNWLVKLPNSPYYMCSKDASKMLHYVTPSLKVIGFDQLDPVYNRPDIVLDSIGKYFDGADKELVANYRAAWEKRVERLGLNREEIGKGEIAVPNAEISNDEQISYENSDGKVVIHVEANDPKYNLRRYNVLVNEVPIFGSSGVSIADLNTQVWERTDTINLSIGRNKIQVSVMNELGLENFKYPTYVNYTPNNDIVSKTYFVGIGVNEFKDAGHNLKYCVKDVQDLATAFAKNDSSVDTILFTNSEVTKENILAVKTYLQNNTTLNDKVIISCSSHGLLDDSLNFYLATYDVDFKNPKQRGLKYDALEGLLDGIPARQKLLFLDACNSGENERMFIEDNSRNEIAMNDQKRGEELEIANQEIDSFQKMNELFVNVRNNTGSVIISAAGGLQSALEAIEVDGKEIKNGAFTYSVLECLNTKQDLKVNDLKLFVEKRVAEITNGKQKPTSRQETMEVDWELFH